MQSSYVPEEVWEADQAVVRTFPHSKRVGQYLLGRLIGEGSFAKVRESLHTTTAYKVAVKVINKKKARQDAYVKRNLRREARVMQQLRHANIIQLYEVIETDNSYYLVMELCRGGGLMEHICAKRRLSESESCRYMRQILSAVHYMHRAGVIHRDLKIENLLLDENRNIKIIDFGLSTIVRTEVEGRCEVEELCVTQCGSPAYAAPELLSSKKYGSKVDIWSIGVNMFAMLTGTLPFTVEPFHVKALYNKMVAGDMNPLPAYLSRESKDLIKKFLIAEPEWRISLTAAMEHPWITGGGVRRLEPAVFPNRLRSTDLDEVVVQRMSQHLNYRISDIIRCVINNTPNSVTATYHYLRHKLLRFKAERGLFQKISAEMSLPFIPSDSVDSTKVDLFQERRTRHDSDISEGEVVRSKPLNIAHLPQITAAYQKSVQAKIEAFGSDNGQKRVGDTNDTQTTAFISVVEDERMANENSSCDSGVTVERVSLVHDTTIRHTRAADTGPSTGTGIAVGTSDNTALKSDYTRATAASQYRRHTSEVAKHNSNTTQTAKGTNADAVKWKNVNGAAVHTLTTQTLSDKAKAKSNGETGRQVTQMSTVRRLPYLPLSTVLSARQPANTVPVNSASNSKLTLRDVIQQGDDSHSLARRHSRPHNHLPALANSPR